jgi:hypothetical protein
MHRRHSRSFLVFDNFFLIFQLVSGIFRKPGKELDADCAISSPYLIKIVEFMSPLTTKRFRLQFLIINFIANSLATETRVEKRHCCRFDLVKLRQLFRRGMFDKCSERKYLRTPSTYFVTWKVNRMSRSSLRNSFESAINHFYGWSKGETSFETMFPENCDTKGDLKIT